MPSWCYFETHGSWTLWNSLGSIVKLKSQTTLAVRFVCFKQSNLSDLSCTSHRSMRGVTTMNDLKHMCRQWKHCSRIIDLFSSFNQVDFFCYWNKFWALSFSPSYIDDYVSSKWGCKINLHRDITVLNCITDSASLIAKCMF